MDILSFCLTVTICNDPIHYSAVIIIMYKSHFTRFSSLIFHVNFIYDSGFFSPQNNRFNWINPPKLTNRLILVAENKKASKKGQRHEKNKNKKRVAKVMAQRKNLLPI